MPGIGPERWSRLSPHLSRALEIADEHERAAWLTALGDEDPALATDVKALLGIHRGLQHDRFLETPLPFAPPEAPPAAAVGAYTLVCPIGRGGMGTVWLAERSDGRFERRVAVKFLIRALIGEAERFRREGRILARLRHRHIAQLLDAGVAADGQPYLVLEHVDGEPIDEYCRRRDLDLPARLRLFLDVLDAVAHAHTSLVVHRDIKPSNVLVTADGQVKLLDFGIAKLLADDDEGRAATLTAPTALTPAYAAPEQVQGHPVSTATDVYALGVLLYVLLTGRHPAAEHLPSPADLMHAITSADPPRPSAVAAPKHRRLLRGDLDTIVGVALKKPPGERFGSVTAFADDVRRYLRDEPIAARRDAVAYRTAKFIRRHRVAVAAAAGIVVILCLGLYTTHQARTLAEQRFMQVRQLANRVMALDPLIAPLPGSTRARHEIVGMAKEYLEGLRPDTSDDLDLALEVAVAYSALARTQGVPANPNLGQSTQAEESLRAADTLLDAVIDRAPGHPTALLESAIVAQGRMMLADSDRRGDEALAQARKAAGRLDALIGAGPIAEPTAAQVARLFANIALAFKNADRFVESVDYARRSMATAPSGARGIELRANAASIMADALRLSGDLEGALSAIREARRLLETLDAGTVWPASLFNVLWREGVILGDEDRVSLGRAEQAVPVLEHAIDVIERWASSDADNAASRVLFASAARELGRILGERDPERALAVYDHGLRRLGEVKDNPRARRGEVDLLTGSTYPLRRLGRFAEARGRLDGAFTRMQELKLYPTQRLELGSEADAALRARADHEAAAGDLARALATYRTLLDSLQTSGPAAERHLTAAADLARLYAAMRRLARQAGDEPLAADLQARRVALWQHWARTLPQNAFVQAALTSAARGD